ncbi:MAG: ThuA domain-containing protein [Verrucomicrobia bacterium]|nr:ThuA domain-containing protein [Verrucomicrobiota bacterium]
MKLLGLFTSLCCWLLGGAVTISVAAPPPPAPALRSEVEAVLAKAATTKEPARKLRIVLLADKKDHREHEHDYPVWQERWALLLGGRAASKAEQVNLYGPANADAKAAVGAGNVEIACAWNWPTEEQFASANVIVAFCYLAWTDEHQRQIKQYLERGGGLVLIHSATWTKPKASADVAALVGVGGFTRYRHGPMQVEIIAAEYPICRGLPPKLSFLDEPYWPPTPPLAGDRVTALAVSREKPDKESEQTAPQPMFWTCQTGRGRVSGCVPGHYTWTFDDPWFRLLLLRGIAWAAGEPSSRFDPLVLRGARVTDK